MDPLGPLPDLAWASRIFLTGCFCLVQDHPTVYQSFTSSGIFSRWLDGIVNRVWDDAVNACRSGGDQKPFDLLLPKAVQTMAAAMVLPLFALAALERMIDF
jgi:hypothetical protein